MTTKKPAKPPASKKAGKGEIADAQARGYQFYVYVLSDRDGAFYVGKGQRNRMFAHGKASVDRNGQKLKRIYQAGQDAVERTVIAYFKDEGAALACEKAWMSDLTGLTNIAPGRGDPYEEAKASAAAMLARVIPFEESRASRSTFTLPQCGLHTPRAVYDALVALIRAEAEEPTPTTFMVMRDGSVARRYGERHGARR